MALAAERYPSGDGVLDYEAPHGNVMAYKVSGRVTVDLVRHLMGLYDELAAATPPPHVAFCDLSEAETYETEARTIATDWFKKHRRDISAFHVVVHSKLVAMGVSMLGLVSGVKLHSYSDTKPFEAAKAAARQGTP